MRWLKKTTAAFAAAFVGYVVSAAGAMAFFDMPGQLEGKTNVELDASFRRLTGKFGALAAKLPADSSSGDAFGEISSVLKEEPLAGGLMLTAIKVNGVAFSGAFLAAVVGGLVVGRKRRVGVQPSGPDLRP